MTTSTRVELGGLALDALDVTQAEDTIGELAGRGKGAAVHLCNSYTFSLARQDRSYRELLNASRLRLVDGKPLKWLLDLERGTGEDHGVCRGPDLFRRSVLAQNGLDMRHLLLGGDGETLDRLVAATRSGGSTRVAGSAAPPYSENLDDLLDFCSAALEETPSEVVWVGLGTPKQDLIASRLARRHRGVFIAVGAAFDFLAGTKREAPAWLHGTGLEWTYRLATEPGRLLPRYCSSLAAVAGQAGRSATARVRTATAALCGS